MRVFLFVIHFRGTLPLSEITFFLCLPVQNTLSSLIDCGCVRNGVKYKWGKRNSV